MEDLYQFTDYTKNAKKILLEELVLTLETKIKAKIIELNHYEIVFECEKLELDDYILLKQKKNLICQIDYLGQEILFTSEQNWQRALDFDNEYAIMASFFIKSVTSENQNNMFSIINNLKRLQ